MTRMGIVMTLGAVCAAGLVSPDALAAEDTGGGEIRLGGPLGQRLKLTGDWGGKRDELAEKGVTINLDTVGVVQGVVDGGVRKHDRWGGSNALELKVNLDQMGAMPGAFLDIKAEAKFGQFANADTGTIISPNADALFPMPLGNDVTLTSVVYTQFLSEQFGLFLGKLETLSNGDMNEFAQGRGEEQFMNTAFVLNPITLGTVPYAGLGGGAIVIPNEKTLWVFSVIDKEGEANKSGFDTVFKDGTTLASELRFTTNFFDRPGHILVGGTWCNEVTGFEDRLTAPRASGPLGGLFEEEEGRPGGGTILPLLRQLLRLTKEESWSVFANFDQYFYVEDAESRQGIGLFGRFGLSDGDPNILHHFYSIGLGGKGVIPGRDEDTFGIGYYYADISGNLPTLLSSSGETARASSCSTTSKRRRGCTSRPTYKS